MSLSNDTIKDINKSDLVAIKLLAHSVFQKYLNNNWRHIEIDDFKIEALSGGISNYLYKCEITNRKTLRQTQSQPDKLIFRLLPFEFYTNFILKIRIIVYNLKRKTRLYGEHRLKEDGSILIDVITSLELNGAISSPKIYAFLPFGRLEEYINVHNS